MEQFVKIFGHMTIADAVVFLAAMGFIVMICVKTYKAITKFHDEVQDRQSSIDTMSEALLKIKDTQDKIVDSINRIQEKQQDMETRQTAIEEGRRLRDINKLKDKLIQSANYYTSQQKNPMQKWSEMERDAWDALCQDYYKLGGNSWVHTDVEPMMKKMEVVPMNDTAAVAELMQSRKG